MQSILQRTLLRSSLCIRCQAMKLEQQHTWSSDTREMPQSAAASIVARRWSLLYSDGTVITTSTTLSPKYSSACSFNTCTRHASYLHGNLIKAFTITCDPGL